MIKPSYLKEGDVVALVCSARKFSLEEAQPAMELMKSWGLNVKIGKTIGLDNFQLGGTDKERAQDIQDQLDDPNVKAIWCARGGYGTVRIIDKLDFSKFLENPKWIIGFSDISVFHSHIHNLGVETIHGIMAFSVPKASLNSKQSLRDALFGEPLKYSIDSSLANRRGQASCILIGGNLSIIYSLLGSASTVNTFGKILFIEDLDEYLYHLDRMMYNLKRNGYFENLKGLIVGGMTDMHDNSIPFGQDEVQIISEIVREFDFPVCFNFPSGHLSENFALRLGSNVDFKVDKDGVSLEFL